MAIISDECSFHPCMPKQRRLLHVTLWNMSSSGSDIGLEEGKPMCTDCRFGADCSKTALSIGASSCIRASRSSVPSPKCSSIVLSFEISRANVPGRTSEMALWGSRLGEENLEHGECEISRASPIVFVLCEHAVCQLNSRYCRMCPLFRNHRTSS